MQNITTPWQRRRSAFNHDWLKNRFMPALAKLLNVLDGRIEDQQFEKLFFIEILPRWEEHREDALALLRDFEKEMSPRRFLAHPPLSQCTDDMKDYLEGIVHTLWLSRYSIREVIQEALVAVQAADDLYSRIVSIGEGNMENMSIKTLRSSRQVFAEFRDKCQKIAHTIERLPSEIRVV